MENIQKQQIDENTSTGYLIFNIIYGILIAGIGISGLFFDHLQAALTTSYFFGFLIMFVGIAWIFSAFGVKGQGDKKWWLLLISGIAGIFVGVWLLKYPIKEFLTLVYVFGIYLVAMSIVRLIQTREQWGLTILYAIMGVIIAMYPGWFTVWAYIMIFILFIFNGVFTIYISIKTLNTKRHLKKQNK